MSGAWVSRWASLMLGYIGINPVPGSGGEGPGAGLTGVGLTFESAVMILGPGSVWTDQYPGSTEANQIPITTAVGPVSWCLGTSLVLGWSGSLVSQ